MDLNFHNWSRKILHFLSVTGMFMILFGFFSLLQMFTVGILFDLNNKLIAGIPFPVIYCIISIFIIKRYFIISSPYDKKTSV